MNSVNSANNIVDSVNNAVDCEGKGVDKRANFAMAKEQREKG